MAYPHAHKTVFVLDKGIFFANSSKQVVEFDVFTKNRGVGFIPLTPVSKSLWTCNVEAVIEYCRVMYDIFPTGRNVCLISTDNEAIKINDWARKEQNLQHMMVALARAGQPSTDLKKEDCSLLPGLVKAMSIMAEQTLEQQKILATTDDTTSFLNRGQIMCLTHCRNEVQVKALEEAALEALTEQNRQATENEGMMAIDHVELVIIHVTPVGLEGPIRAKMKRELSGVLTTEIHTTQSGRHVALKLIQLVMQQLDLSSTTITGIPMKEEQNASSSANYDVELLHSSKAHTDLISSGNSEGIMIPSKEGLYSKTITLKWLTPKTNVVELQPCTGAYRITPVDVNSRPSSCLTNFLLNGRSVMLEQPRKSGVKVVSHMLTSHGGEIYIHVLASGRSPLEEPPSISEGSERRVTDYRITNFGEFMKENRLAPAGNMASKMDELPIERAKNRLERMTRLWPLTISDTIIFNMLPQLDPLPSLIVKEKMTDDEVLECKKAIYHLVEMESRNESLMVPAIGTRGKGPKRDEQYRQMWNEFEQLVAAHVNTSRNHEKVLECLTECKKPDQGSPKKAVEKSVVKEEAESAWKEFDKFQKMTEKEKQDMTRNADRPSGPSTKRIKTEPAFGLTPFAKGGQSLLSIWTSRMTALNATRHEDFAGRRETKSNKAELYQHMKDENGLNMGKPGADPANKR